MIELRVLGTLDLRDPENGDLGWVLARPKLVALLTYLALVRPRGFHHRDTLVGLFWPESGQARARRALNQAIYELRKALGDGVIVSRGDEEVGLDWARIRCDADAFKAACDGNRLAEALEAYAGDLLPGFALPDCPEFEAWLDERREGLRHRALGAVRTRAAELAASGERVEAAFWLRRALLWEPYDETILRALLVELRALGDRTGALREYAAFARRLRDELGVEPEAETRTLVEAIEASRAVNGGTALSDGGPAPSEREREVARSEPSARGRRRLKTSHRAVFAAGALATAVFVAIASYRAIEGGDARVENGRVVVAELENRTGDPAFDPMGRIASDWIVQELHRTGLVQVVPVTAVLEETRRLEEEGMARDELLGSLAASTGAGLVIHGSFVRRADSLYFQVQILDVERGRLARAIAGAGSVGDPLTGVLELSRRATGALATLVDEELSEWADAASQPPSYEAYLAYAEGLALHSEGAYDRGAQAFASAVAADSSFTAALLWEAWSYQLLMYEDNVHLDYDQGRRADSLVARLRHRREPLAPWDRAMLDLLIGERSGNRRLSHEALRRLVKLGPDPRFQVHYAWVAMARNYTREALAAISEVTYQEAEARDLTGTWRALLAKGYHRLGDYERELALVREWRQREPSWLSLSNELRANAALGRTAAVDSLIAEILALEPQSWGSATLDIRELEIHGYAEQAERLDEIVQQRREPTPPSERDDWAWMREVRALAVAGRWEEARAEGERLLATVPPSDNHIWFLGELGIRAAHLGDEDAAREYLRRIETFDLESIFMVDLEAVVAYKRAEILTALGERQRAIDVLRRAIAADKMVFYHPHFESIFSELDALVGDPTYDRLVAPRG